MENDKVFAVISVLISIVLLVIIAINDYNLGYGLVVAYFLGAADWNTVSKCFWTRKRIKDSKK